MPFPIALHYAQENFARFADRSQEWDGLLVEQTGCLAACRLRPSPGYRVFCIDPVRDIDPGPIGIRKQVVVGVVDEGWHSFFTRDPKCWIGRPCRGQELFYLSGNNLWAVVDLRPSLQNTPPAVDRVALCVQLLKNRVVVIDLVMVSIGPCWRLWGVLHCNFVLLQYFRPRR